MYRESVVAVAEIDWSILNRSEFHTNQTSSLYFFTFLSQSDSTVFLSGYTVNSHCVYFATIVRRDKSRASTDKKP